MAGLEPALKAHLKQLKVRVDKPDDDTLLLRNVPADSRWFNKAQTSVLVKRPRAGLPYLVCVDEDLEYLGPDRQLARVFTAAELMDTTPIGGRLGDLQPVDLQQVRRTGDEPMFNSLMEQHHYLQYEQPVGEHLKYVVWAQGRPIACLAWSSAPRHLGSRDRYIGWSAEARRRNVRFIAYNTRFLILPWVRVPHLASHILGRASSRLSADWERMYGHPVYFAETFIDPGRFRGTCYRAAN
jgi:hypothetical protein